MYSYISGYYFYQTEILEIIDEITILRNTKRLNKEKLKTSFAEDLKNRLLGREH